MLVSSLAGCRSTFREMPRATRFGFPASQIAEKTAAEKRVEEDSSKGPQTSDDGLIEPLQKIGRHDSEFNSPESPFPPAADIQMPDSLQEPADPAPEPLSEEEVVEAFRRSGGKLKPNETGAIVDLNQNSEYAFVLAQSGQNENRFELIFTNAVTSFSTLKNVSSIVIYPNPVNSEKFTVGTANLIGKVTVEVLDVLGRKVDSKVFESLKASTEIQINKPIVAGQYSVKVTDAKGSVVKSLIVE